MRRRGAAAAGARCGAVEATSTFAAAVMALAACLFGCATGGRGEGGRDDGRWIGRPVPDLAVEALDGKTVSLASLRGRVVLLDVWASWCKPCEGELRALEGIAGRLGPRGVEVLAVSVDDERANVMKFLRTHTLRAVTVAHDPRKIVPETFGLTTMPTSYIIDRSGTVRHVNAGFVPEDAPVIERRLAALAAQ